MTLREKIKRKVLEILKVSQNNQMPEEEERLTFINDREALMRMKIREYNIWYNGDSGEILNFYTNNTNIKYYYEPFYNRNKRSYFWSTASTEHDVKLTHSGQPRNIVDTLVSIIGIPEVKVISKELPTGLNKAEYVINRIIEENDFWNKYKQEQLPMTMVEGWGCWKIVWDTDISEYPIPVYYRAENVDFIYKLNRITGVIFKDYYTDGKNRYLITETRHVSHGNLNVEKELFKIEGMTDDDMTLTKMSFKEVEVFKEVEEKIVITDYNGLLSVPCVLYKDATGDGHGRSIFTGKVDLFDDLDQCLSQAANSVRKSTPIEYIDTDYLERDPKTGLPVQPKAYDRKYIKFVGSKTSDGSSQSSTPVVVTQPSLDFDKYSQQATQVLLQIMNGLISPATLGLDVAKKDNAEAQREKEKITVFTRNNISSSEKRILEQLFNELLIANELMHTEHITVLNYDVSVIYPEFADESYENKINVLGEQLAKATLSPEMYLTKLYNGKLSESDYKKELDYLKEAHSGENENPYDEGEFNPSTDPMKEDELGELDL